MLAGRLLNVEDRGTLTVEINGAVRTFWNHDPDHLREFVGGVVAYQPEWSVLRVRTGSSSSYAFSVIERPRTRGVLGTSDLVRLRPAR
jgi:hypothetical protein